MIDLVGNEGGIDNKESGMSLVGEDEVAEKREWVRIPKVKPKTWDEYIKEQKEIFDVLSEEGRINATLTINNIPNEAEFHELLTVLTDEYGHGLIEFVIINNGFNKFYHLYKSSGLFDVVKANKRINSAFNSEKLELYKIGLTNTILASRAEKRLVLRISGKNKRMVGRLLQDIKVPESDFGLMCCFFTFNKVKHKLDDYITEKYEAFYDDDGYVMLINTEISRANIYGIARLISALETMYSDIDSITKEYLYDPQSASHKLIKHITVKRKAMLDVILCIENSATKVSMKDQLLISAFKEDLNNICIIRTDNT